MAKFQIHDGDRGRALYDADTATEALLDFIATKTKADLRPTVAADAGAGTAAVTVDGTTYRALPFRES